MTKVIKMKPIEYTMPPQKAQMLAEPAVMYVANPRVGVFSHARFQSLSSKLSFTQQEWADILHISDRTLQRYLKEERSFEGLHAEHLHQLDALAGLGIAVFGSPSAFEAWLRRPKSILGQDVGFSALRSFGGTQLLGDELGRMLHGVYI